MNAVAQDAAPAKPAAKKTEYESVEMEDGSTEEFPISASGARERILNKDWGHYGADGGFVSGAATSSGLVTVRLAFRNGKVINHEISAHDPLRSQYIGHGALQKLGDETAGAKSIGDAIDWVENLVDQLKAGKWSSGRAPGSGDAGSSVLAQAIFIFRERLGKPLTREQVREYLRDKPQKAKIQMRGEPRLASIIKEIEAQQEKSDPAASAALADEIEAL